MSNKFRLSSGGQINRTERISFKFNGKTFFGFKGDTLASALLANGVHLVGRSFKYHRPRGIFSSGAEETNALVQVISGKGKTCLLYTSPSPRDLSTSRMPSSA